MSWDVTLNDPVTGNTLLLDEPHQMRGGTYAIGGTRECWLNVTWNYSNYYFEAADGDERFAYQDSDGKIEHGFRGLYGKTAVESIPMLEDLAARIGKKYKNPDGTWKTARRKRQRFFDNHGIEIDFPQYIKLPDGKRSCKEDDYVVSEGDTSNYYERTAANAIKALEQLEAFAKLRPDGVWDGD